MPHYVSQTWTPADGSGIPRSDKRGGEFFAFLPDTISDAAMAIEPKLSQRAADIERQIIALNRREGAGQLESIARLLMRSEAISSSRIEGIAPNVDKVVLAELAQEEEVRGFKESAEAVARNLQVLRSVESAFATVPAITPELLSQFQTELLGARPTVPTGLRTIQNWIGGSQRTPIGAEFIPPPPQEVSRLVADLCTYLNGATHGALIQAAIVHAQFETIHPFADGNGRVGRALIHGTLQRRGITRQTILPISLVLGTWSERYIDGLTKYREGNLSAWLETFLDAAVEATKQANLITDQLLEVQSQWKATLDEHRKRQGMQRALRSDSIEFKVLAGLPAHPIVTTKSLERLYGVSSSNARKALDNLAEVGILRTKVVGIRGAAGYYADDVLDLLDIADRQLASSQFDTRLAPPTGRAVPRR
ncbi:Fic family protein [Corynebacterium ulceribovis]|uniref:Fic family protein n=1 Tax=Corynebacterium ulceribovis TaxID=487732 RepID=UPI00035E027E|nr:Fic family protein [Corynebacterium ulceribovis]